MSTNFIVLRGGAEGAGPSDVLLALNPQNVTHVSAAEAKGEEVLRIHLLGGRFLTIPDTAAAEVLEALGLSELVEEDGADEPQVSS
jgi:hypothetical protein